MWQFLKIKQWRKVPEGVSSNIGNDAGPQS